MIEVRLRLARRAFTLDVDLALPARAISAIFGASGCGKTTLLRSLAGLERGDGRVAVEGEVWQDGTRFVPPHRRAIGYVIQEAALFPHLSVAANLDYGRRRAGADARDAAVELLGIGSLLPRRPGTLSGGERQRVAIARALASAPRLLLMDEPLAALDAARKAEILPYLERLHRERAIPIVYVSHAIDEVARLADHLVLLEAGRALASGPLAEVLARPDGPPLRSVDGHDETGAVVAATLAEHDDDYALSRIAFDGGSLWLARIDQPLGIELRARVLARDVSLTAEAPRATSILNVLPATVAALHDDAQAATVLVALRLGDDAGGTPLLARITRRSRDAMRLAPGVAVFAQIKSASLM